MNIKTLLFVWIRYRSTLFPTLSAQVGLDVAAEATLDTAKLMSGRVRPLSHSSPPLIH